MKIFRCTTVAQSIFFFEPTTDIITNMGWKQVLISSPGKELNEFRRKHGTMIYPVPMQRRISPLNDFLSLWKLIRAIKKLKPDMVHSMTPKAGLLCMIAAWICHVPVRVHTFTGLVFPTSTGLKRKILMATDRLTCFCATHIIPEGEGVKADLLNNRITKKTLKVLGHGNVRGINLEHYDPNRSDVLRAAARLRCNNITTFIFIGRLVSDKGINELVEAFTNLHVKYPSTRLILVGEQEQTLDPLLPETIVKIKGHSAIEAVGRQNDVRPWLAASDVFVFPSYREGFPNVVIEAGAMGLPSIVTDINGSREIIINGNNGIIIPPRQSERLKCAMEMFVTNPELTKSLSKDARSLISNRYEESFVSSCLINYYKEILNK